MSQQLTLALSKGRIFEETLPLLKAAGIVVTEDPETSRKLILPTNDPNVRVIIVRASDVPTYVQYGAADFGVAGKDVLYEHGGESLYQPIDLNIAQCRMSVAVPNGFDYANAVRQGARLRVATKYVQIAREHFAAKGVHVDLIKLYGSMELAPLIGLADAIVDLATLTGACVIALGEEIAGLWSPSDALAEALLQAGEQGGENLWRMPLRASYREGLKSGLADMKNTGPRPGGSITAALFLQDFVAPEVAWAHLDIAGTVWSDKGRGLDPAGATGYGVRTLVNWVQAGGPA